jgi:glutathione-regulated potassium-efflux system ancillary protein KefG
MDHKILLLFAHPRFEKSRANSSMLTALKKHPQITFHDLYENYPNFNVDIERETNLLLEHSIIIWHHPFYWYSAPPLLKQWIDMVLEFGWAYGPGGTFLKDKIIFNSITSGGAREVYMSTGHNRFTIREFLAPFDQTATLCKMVYLPPFAIQGTHRLSEQDLQAQSSSYDQLLQRLVKGEFNVDEIRQYEFMNDWISKTSKL